MRFFERYTARLCRLRPVFDQHLDAVATIAVASSVAGLLAASLIASRDAVVLVIALSACGAVVHVGYRVRPKVKLRRAARIGLRRGEFHVVYQPIVDTHTRHCVGIEALLRGATQSSEPEGQGYSLESSKARVCSER
jgi:sensor c-di-GMP phosphodiesterase-like protein